MQNLSQSLFMSTNFTRDSVLSRRKVSKIDADMETQIYNSKDGLLYISQSIDSLNKNLEKLNDKNQVHFMAKQQVNDCSKHLFLNLFNKDCAPDRLWLEIFLSEITYENLIDFFNEFQTKEEIYDLERLDHKISILNQKTIEEIIDII